MQDRAVMEPKRCKSLTSLELQTRLKCSLRQLAQWNVQTFHDDELQRTPHYNCPTLLEHKSFLQHRDDVQHSRSIQSRADFVQQRDVLLF
jgi:hypothetical protein